MTGNNQAEKTAQSIRQLMAASGSDSAPGSAPGSKFVRILDRARALDRLNQRVSGLLGDELARTCQVANVRDGRMIFACTSAGSATRLRMLCPKLLADLHAAGLDEIKAIEVKMMPSPGV